MIGALGRMHEWEIHCRGALANGCSVEQIRAAIHAVGIYCGVPQALECFRAARKGAGRTGAAAGPEPWLPGDGWARLRRSRREAASGRQGREPTEVDEVLLCGRALLEFRHLAMNSLGVTPPPMRWRRFPITSRCSTAPAQARGDGTVGASLARNVRNR